MGSTNDGRRASLAGAVSVLGLALGVAPAADAQVTERKAGGKPVEYGRPGGSEACAAKRGIDEGPATQAWSWGASNSGSARPGGAVESRQIKMTDLIISGRNAPGAEANQQKQAGGAMQSNQNKHATDCAVEGNFQKIEFDK